MRGPAHLLRAGRPPGRCSGNGTGRELDFRRGSWVLGLFVETELGFVPAPGLNFIFLFYIEEGLLELLEDEVNLELTKEAEVTFKAD